MARVALLCPDLLFGSKVEGGLGSAGHSVDRFDSDEAARAAVARGVDVLVVDLGAEGVDGAALVESIRSSREMRGAATLGFYPHVEQETRLRAEAAGFDLVVPRSRMARDMGMLVERLAAGTTGAAPTPAE